MWTLKILNLYVDLGGRSHRSSLSNCIIQWSGMKLIFEGALPVVVLKCSQRKDTIVDNACP